MYTRVRSSFFLYDSKYKKNLTDIPLIIDHMAKRPYKKNNYSYILPESEEDDDEDLPILELKGGQSISPMHVVNLIEVVPIIYKTLCSLWDYLFTEDNTSEDKVIKPSPSDNNGFSLSNDKDKRPKYKVLKPSPSDNNNDFFLSDDDDYTFNDEKEALEDIEEEGYNIITDFINTPLSPSFIKDADDLYNSLNADPVTIVDSIELRMRNTIEEIISKKSIDRLHDLALARTLYNMNNIEEVNDYLTSDSDSEPPPLDNWLFERMEDFFSQDTAPRPFENKAFLGLTSFMDPENEIFDHYSGKTIPTSTDVSLQNTLQSKGNLKNVFNFFFNGHYLEFTHLKELNLKDNLYYSQPARADAFYRIIKGGTFTSEQRERLEVNIAHLIGKLYNQHKYIMGRKLRMADFARRKEYDIMCNISRLKEEILFLRNLRESKLSTRAAHKTIFIETYIKTVEQDLEVKIHLLQILREHNDTLIMLENSLMQGYVYTLKKYCKAFKEVTK